MVEDPKRVSQLVRSGEGHTCIDSWRRWIEAGINENPHRRLKLPASAGQIEVGASLTLRSGAGQPDHAESTLYRTTGPHDHVSRVGVRNGHCIELPVQKGGLPAVYACLDVSREVQGL